MKTWWHLIISAITLVGVLYIASTVRDLRQDTGIGTSAGTEVPTPAPTPVPPPVAEPPSFAGGCFHVVPDPPPSAHLSLGDRYCVQEQSPNVWVLIPGTGMEDWHSIAGPKEITLDVKANNPGLFYAEFDMEVDGHPEEGPSSSHGPKHQLPNFRFTVQINVTSATIATAIIRGLGGSGGPVHAGSAHAEV